MFLSTTTIYFLQPSLYIYGEHLCLVVRAIDKTKRDRKSKEGCLEQHQWGF